MSSSGCKDREVSVFLSADHNIAALFGAKSGALGAEVDCWCWRDPTLHQTDFVLFGHLLRPRSAGAPTSFEGETPRVGGAVKMALLITTTQS